MPLKSISTSRVKMAQSSWVRLVSCLWGISSMVINVLRHSKTSLAWVSQLGKFSLSSSWWDDCSQHRNSYLSLELSNLWWRRLCCLINRRLLLGIWRRRLSSKINRLIRLRHLDLSNGKSFSRTFCMFGMKSSSSRLQISSSCKAQSDLLCFATLMERNWR